MSPAWGRPLACPKIRAGGSACPTLRLLLVGAILCLPLLAENSPDHARRVIDDAIKALGGQAFLHMTNRIESGRAYSFYRERLSGLSLATIYTQYLPKTAASGGLAVRERQAFGKHQDSAVLLAGGAGYEITFRGARPLPDAQLERYRESTLRNVFYILRERMDEPGLSLDYRGSDVLDNRPVDIVDITDPDDRVITVYFDQTSKLPTRQLTYRRDPLTKEKIEEVTFYAKYREAEGVMWPFDIQRQRDGEKIYEIYADSVKINADLKDGMFTLPPGMKILRKMK